MAAPDRFHMAGVMGWPVMHSRSPLMHNYWFAQQGLAGTYVPLAIAPDTLEPALRALHPLGFSGCNLTIPHKQEAMRILDRVDEVARKIGAVSCVVVEKDGSLSGTNNDWLGFLGNLKQQALDWRADAGPALVIGAGGGARAICYALMQDGATDIRLVNRTAERAEVLAADLGGPITVLPWEARHDALEGTATVVNTTSQGMVGQAALDLRLDALPRFALVSDIIYTPLASPLLAAAALRGNQTVNGLGMLLHQGVPAWQRWFDLTPEVTPELQSLMEQSLTA
ncbi:MAG: shikimate dehydrogenase [Flavimaricola sp.]|nr:shikimate dehydrogenase [Flavimaricola sp.]